jgi:hypothetical protein
MPPAIVARMASTIDSISGGRFGVNLVTGWQRPEYSQMGLWPGDQFFGTRYQYLSEYVQVLRDLWGTGPVGLQGRALPDGRLPPEPAAAGRHEGDLRRPERRGHGLLGQVRRLQLLLRQGREHAQGLRALGAEADRGHRQDRPPRHDLRADDGDRRRDRRGRPRQVGALQGRRRPGGHRLAGRAGRGRHQVGRRHQRAPDGRPDLGGEHQHGHAGRLLRQRRAHARRSGRGARHRRRAADLRRFREGRRGLRRAHPAADEEPRRTSTRPCRRRYNPSPRPEPSEGARHDDTEEHHPHLDHAGRRAARARCTRTAGAARATRAGGAARRRRRR